LEEDTQASNHAELYVGLIKEDIRKDMHESHSPLWLWCFCAEQRIEVPLGMATPIGMMPLPKRCTTCRLLSKY
jgi:hypothetical protein